MIVTGYYEIQRPSWIYCRKHCIHRDVDVNLLLFWS